MRTNPRESVSLLGLNVQSGGFNSYRPVTPGCEPPEREPALKQFFAEQRASGITAATLTDTYGWDAYYGDDDKIAQHTGFKQAWHQPLNDDRLTKLYGETQVGITFTTDHEVDERESMPIWLETRSGLKTVLKFGRKTLHVLSIYLDDLNDDVREKQVAALLSDWIDPGERNIIIGDINSPSPDLLEAPVSTRVKDLGFQAVAFAFGFVPNRRSATLDYYRQALTGMNRRSATRLLQNKGFIEADPQHHATFHLGPLGLQLDHIMSRAGEEKPLALSNFDVVPAPSDHLGVRATADF